MQSRQRPTEARTTSISNFDVQAPAFTGVIGKPTLSIADELPADFEARESLLDEAFGPARSDKTVERLREGRLPAQGFALAAKDGGELIGTLRMWHILAGDVEALLLGPLAVAKAYRSRGLGRRLMAEALFRAASAGHKAVLLVGDAAYYEPFGFSRRHTLGLVLPGPVDEARFLGLELTGGALKAAQGFVVAAGARDHPAHRWSDRVPPRRLGVLPAGTKALAESRGKSSILGISGDIIRYAMP